MVKSTEPFAFNYVPPKEGRVPPPGVRIQRRRRAIAIAILSIGAIICLVLKYVQTTSVSASRAKIETGIEEKFKSGKEKIQKIVDDKLASSPTSGVTDSIPPSAPGKAVHPAPVPEKSTFPFKDSEFDDLFLDILNKIPNELNQRLFLTPITNSGPERMHDVGLRTREFKRLFQAWEKLHVIYPGDKSVHIQDGVIPYLRSRSVNSKLKLNAGRSAETVTLELGPTLREYETFRWLLQNLGDVLFPWVRPFFGDHIAMHTQLYGGGRGIVYTAGTDQAPFVETSISVLRKLGCTLPIEVLYLGEGDLDQDSRERLEDLPGVITRDIRRMVKDEGWQIAGWAGKPFAILLSSFREVIFIDADALFLQNPEQLFEDEGYKNTGALFFYDRLMRAGGKRSWLETVLPKPVTKKARKSRLWGESDHMQESGVVVVDTFRHFIPLLVVCRMNGEDRDGNSDRGIVGVYDMLFGDKETFWISWELVGDTQYSFHRGPAGVIGNLAEHLRNISHATKSQTTTSGIRETHTYAKDISICAPQLLHIDYDGAPLWFNGWILANKFDKERSPMADLEMYMREPDHFTEPESWVIRENNNCCLTAKETLQFTDREKKTIDMIIQTAIEVRAVGKHGGAPRRGEADLYH